MNMSFNHNISKEFRKRLDVISKWRKGKNHNVNVISHTYKNSEGKEVTVWTRKTSNEAWGRPGKFMMK